MAFNWLLKQHRSKAARIKNQFLLSTQLWPFNLSVPSNRWLNNQKKTFLFIQYAFWAFSFVFCFDFICCVYLYRVIIPHRDVCGGEIMSVERARTTGRILYIVFQFFLLCISFFEAIITVWIPILFQLFYVSFSVVFDIKFDEWSCEVWEQEELNVCQVKGTQGRWLVGCLTS